MLKFLLSIILISLLLNNSIGNEENQIWKSCGTSNDILKINSIIVKPTPPIKGKLFKIDINGTFNKDVEGGEAKIIAKFNNLMTLYNQTNDLCSSTSKAIIGNCPFKKGPYLHSANFTIPTSAPTGYYSGNILLTDNFNNSITCINVGFNLE
ncbi:hypothetical protein RB653_000615 [Dictyostelium firmibasis]|uniref:MD-2-related lipid-recognition domain-containing protein n=1 Tax=Dictyostelium firmibasis TaxID=79012 RepID=A0AAN7YQS6_9MYCE